MPFIRYDTGDIGVFDSSPCPCKRGLPRLRSILGRSCDFAVAPDGKKYHEEFFSYLFKEVPAVERFCVEQNSREELKINLCCARPLKTADREHIRSILGRHFNGMKIELAETRELPVQKSGKFRYIINNIPEEKA
jgi:phenylacetate-CoA ligase